MRKKYRETISIIFKAYQKILVFISTTYQKLIIITAVVAVFSLCIFVQYKNIFFNSHCDSIRKEINELNNKIKNLKNKQATLEANVTANSDELETLKANLTTLDQALIDATTSLNSLN